MPRKCHKEQNNFLKNLKHFFFQSARQWVKEKLRFFKMLNHPFDYKMEASRYRDYSYVAIILTSLKVEKI